MPRQRKNASDGWMPPRVRRGRSAYEWHTPQGKVIRLCRLDAAPAVVLKRYEEAVTTTPADGSLDWIADEYFVSLNFKRLAKVTREDYEQAKKKPLATFGKMQANNIKPEHIRKYMDKRGEASQYRANRELSLLTVIFSYGRERGYVKSNPAEVIKPFPEKRRDRYVSQSEYLESWKKAPPPVQVAMELAYCTGLRQADILSLTWSQVGDAIMVKQQKTGRALAKEITPRVRKALEQAKRLPKPKDVIPINVIHTRRGAKYTRSGFATIWHRLGFGFTFHDLRRAGTTDYAGDRKSFTGHTSEKMAERYNVQPIKSPSH